ncbi:MAG: mechanosensitive ion channel family protein [Gammaproteobacteria bacterium]|nr:mechanosensitive ion channel family protein [Gammaproteobacteria bacterium]MBU1731274.1 mechanosensitive ion channel family protein [Gammaproteobacteria bacterium]MBU1892779.1 mechanosensitive ion channel family protein [Gammaproteobacteria bacterium]
MEVWLELFSVLHAYIPALVAAMLVALLLWGMDWLLLRRRPDMGAELSLPRQLIMLLLTMAGILLVLLLIPMSDTTRGQVLSLLGLVATGVIALSSTTFVANAMAGIMLRAVGSFRSGDFIRVGEQFGRVTERGLFHTEIQTEERELSTLPNLYLVNNPVTVVRTSGTIVSATLSLGYDISRKRIEKLLKKAAEEAGLEDPFVQVKNLGDFSVSYRVAGFLAEIKQLLTARSNLQKSILDVLHDDGVEIVSPTFMSQRQLPEVRKVIPEADAADGISRETAEEEPEALIFDKAEEAEKLEMERNEPILLKQRLVELDALKEAASGVERVRIEAEIDAARQRVEELGKSGDLPPA